MSQSESRNHGTTRSRQQIESMMDELGYDLHVHPAHIIRKAHQRATTYFQQVMAGQDLTPTQFAALSAILREHEVSQNQLGRLTAMDPSTISLVVRKLRKLGLVDKSASATDQRLTILRLTDRGEEYTLERMAKSVDAGRRLLSPLSSAEQAILLELLQKISEAPTER